MKPLLLLLAYMLGEIAGFVLVGQWLGLWPTLGLVILSAIIGIMIIRAHARRLGVSLRGSVDEIRISPPTIAGGALITLGAVLLILPGFLSDIVALPFLIAPLRRLIVASEARRRQRGKPDSPSDAGATIIDGTFYELDPDETPHPPRDNPSGWTRH